MSRKLTASDRSRLIRLASTLPKGSSERKAILVGLSKVKVARSLTVTFNIEVEDEVIMEDAEDGVREAMKIMGGEEEEVPEKARKKLEDEAIASVSSIFKKRVKRGRYRGGALQCSFDVASDEIADVERLIKKHSYAGTDQIATGVEYTITRDFEIR